MRHIYVSQQIQVPLDFGFSTVLATVRQKVKYLKHQQIFYATENEHNARIKQLCIMNAFLFPLSTFAEWAPQGTAATAPRLLQLWARHLRLHIGLGLCQMDHERGRYRDVSSAYLVTWNKPVVKSTVGCVIDVSNWTKYWLSLHWAYIHSCLLSNYIIVGDSSLHQPQIFQ